MKKILVFFVFALTILVLAGALFFVSIEGSGEIISGGKCGIENCHGLDIVCGRDVPDACDMMYQIGDFCRQFATCREDNNECVLVKDNKFEPCKKCVENCTKLNENNPEKAFQCENACHNQIENNDNNEQKIVVEIPLAGETVSSPMLIEGKARGSWFFEAGFPVELLDKDRKVIASTVAQAKSDWMTNDYVDFEAELDFNVSVSMPGTLVLKRDNPSGLPENDDQIEISLNLQKTETIILKAYFSNNDLDPEISCDKVFAVERKVIKTDAVAKTAIEELLKGPTESEKSSGYFTNINLGVKIQKLTIQNKIAYVDFSGQIDQAGGSCRVLAIRAQIAQTLKQFSSVQEVVISVDGQTEGILQP